MKALILAGGYGTRLYPLIKDTAKALLEVKEKPIIDYLLEKIKGFEDITGVIVVTNEKFYDDFSQWAQTHNDYPHPIEVINDHTKTPDDRLGSIGDIHYVLQQTKIDEDLLVAGGDNIFDFDVVDYIKFSKNKNPHATVGLFDIKDKSSAKKFGVVALDDENRITSFEEKPESPKSSLIAMCFYYFPKDNLHYFDQYMNECQKPDAAGGYIRWLASQEEVYGFRFEGKWYDIGSIQSYNDAQQNL